MHPSSCGPTTLYSDGSSYVGYVGAAWSGALFRDTTQRPLLHRFAGVRKRVVFTFPRVSWSLAGLSGDRMTPSWDTRVQSGRL